MMQGIVESKQVTLLMNEKHKCDRAQRIGVRKRKSVRGCIVAQDMAVLYLVITYIGKQEVPGITDWPMLRRLGPKRASKIRKLFASEQGMAKNAKAEERDEVKKYVVRRAIEKDSKKTKYKAPKSIDFSQLKGFGGSARRRQRKREMSENQNIRGKL